MRRILLAIILSVWALPALAQQNLFPDVERIRADYPTPMSPAQHGEFLNRIAWEHRDEGWGLLIKTGGNRCPAPQGVEVACDILVYAPNPWHFDVLSDVGVTDAPSWFDDGPCMSPPSGCDMARFLAPIRPVGFFTSRGDFNGDGRADFAVYRPSAGLWLVNNVGAVAWGDGSDIPVPGNYDGSGRTQIAVFRPTTGQWFLLNQSPIVFGGPGDIPVPEDYDGDGKTDIAVFRPSTGEWFVYGQQAPMVYGAPGDIPVPGDYTGAGRAQFAVFRRGAWIINGGATIQWGVPGDIPVPADYDGDGRVDAAVYRPSTGGWAVAGQFNALWGAPGDIPVPQDVNGDGRVELVVYRPSSGIWFALDPRTGATSGQAFGGAGDVPVLTPAWRRRVVAGDTDGDRRADLTLFRPSNATWYSLLTSTGLATTASVQWGASSDVPVLANFLGLGRNETAVFRDGTWYIPGGPAITWGTSGDIPLAGDVDGDGRADLIVFRNGAWFVLFSSGGFTSAAMFNLGAAGDIPMVGDYDGDGKADFGIFRNGLWAGLLSTTNYSASLTGTWGTAGDVPVQLDYDGDGRLDIAVFRPSTGTWYIRQSSDGTGVAKVFGTSGDVPVPADYDGDGRADIAVFRPTTATWYVLGVGAVNFGIAGDVPIVAHP